MTANICFEVRFLGKSQTITYQQSLGNQRNKEKTVETSRWNRERQKPPTFPHQIQKSVVSLCSFEFCAENNKISARIKFSSVTNRQNCPRFPFHIV